MLALLVGWQVVVLNLLSLRHYYPDTAKRLGALLVFEMRC